MFNVENSAKLDVEDIRKSHHKQDHFCFFFFANILLQFLFFFFLFFCSFYFLKLESGVKKCIISTGCVYTILALSLKHIIYCYASKRLNYGKYNVYRCIAEVRSGRLSTSPIQKIWTCEKISKHFHSFVQKRLWFCRAIAKKVC